MGQTTETIIEEKKKKKNLYWYSFVHTLRIRTHSNTFSRMPTPLKVFIDRIIGEPKRNRSLTGYDTCTDSIRILHTPRSAGAKTHWQKPTGAPYPAGVLLSSLEKEAGGAEPQLLPPNLIPKTLNRAAAQLDCTPQRERGATQVELPQQLLRPTGTQTRASFFVISTAEDWLGIAGT